MRMSGMPVAVKENDKEIKRQYGDTKYAEIQLNTSLLCLTVRMNAML